MSIEQHAEAAANDIGETPTSTLGTVEHIIAKHMQSAIEEATASLRARNDTLVCEIDRLESEIVRANTERIRTQESYQKTDSEVVQTLGKALHYPWFRDDQANFPGATEADGVCVGDHVAESLAVEAAKRIAALEGLGPLITEFGLHLEMFGRHGDQRNLNVATKAKNEINAILKGGA